MRTFPFVIIILKSCVHDDGDGRYKAINDNNNNSNDDDDKTKNNDYKK